MSHDSLLLLISGPAGSGKTTLCDRLLEEFASGLQRVITTTTRLPREGEVDGVDYHFLNEAEFLHNVCSDAVPFVNLFVRTVLAIAGQRIKADRSASVESIWRCGAPDLQPVPIVHDWG